MPKGAKTLLAERLEPLLPGFRREGWVWNRRTGGVVQGVDLEGSKHGGMVGVHWGLMPEGWPGIARADAGEHYRTAGFAVTGSLGAFEKGHSGWWPLTVVREGVPEDMRSLLVTRLLPFFDDMTTTERLLEFAQRGYRIPRRGDPALDANGWPMIWDWPRTPTHQEVTRALLLWFAGREDEAVERLAAVKESEWAAEVLHRLRHG